MSENKCECPCHEPGKQYTIMHAAPCCGPNAPQLDKEIAMSSNTIANAPDTNTLVEGTPAIKTVPVRNEIADGSYDRLKKVIGDKVTAAITEGKTLVMEKPTVVGESSRGTVYSYGPVDYHHWHSVLPEEAQQTFKCNHCGAAWSLLASIAILEDDGSLTYPLAQALVECEDDEVVTAMFARYPDVASDVKNPAARHKHMLPLGQLPMHLLHQEVDDGGYEHFYAAPFQVLRNFNNAHRAFNDLQYVQTLYSKLVAKHLHPEILDKIFKVIEIKMPDVRTDTALTRADEVVKLVKTVRLMDANGNNGFLYLWSQLIIRENGWMGHIFGSILGIVMDAAIEMNDNDNMEMAMLRVKELLSHATSAENYKNKTAPASEQSLDGTMKFLAENNQTGVLSRRLLPIDEVVSVFWTTTEANAAEPAAEEAPMSALERARAALKKQRDPAVSAVAKLDAMIDNHVTSVNMSLATFIESIGNYATLAVSHRTQSMFPVFVTGPSEEGDHDFLLNFDKGVHPYAHLLQTPQPMAYQTIAQMAEVMNADVPYPKELPVMAFFKSQRFPTEPENYVIHLENVGYNFHQMMDKHGSCVLGSTVRSEHFGAYSRPLVELSRNIPMDTHAGKNAAGGIFMRVGMVFNAVRKDGAREEILISSLK